MSEPKTAPKVSIQEDDDAATNAGNKNKDKYFEDNNDEIMIIPDLDEDGIDNDQRVAHAPRNVTRKIPTLQDLENEVKATVPSVDSGFDLGVLLATLVPAALVEEADTTWSFQTLLRDVTDELTAPVRTVSSATTKATAEKEKTSTSKSSDGKKSKTNK